MTTPEGWWRARLWVETLDEPPEDYLREWLASSVIAKKEIRRVNETLVLLRAIAPQAKEEYMEDMEKILIEGAFPYLDLMREFEMRRKERDRQLDEFVKSGPILIRPPRREVQHEPDHGNRDEGLGGQGLGMPTPDRLGRTERQRTRDARPSRVRRPGESG